MLALFLMSHRKTQIALQYAYWLHDACPDMSVFWVHASNADRFRQAYASIAQECCVPGYNDPKEDVLTLLKRWLEGKSRGRWLMVIDNADDMQLFFGAPGESHHEGNLGRYIPECSHGTILVTTRNKQAGLGIAKGTHLIEVQEMDNIDSEKLLRTRLTDDLTSCELSTLLSRLEHLPLALIQATAFIQANTITINEYLRLLDKSEQHIVDLLSEDFETAHGRDSETPRAVAETWILSFEQVQRQNPLASELLSLMSLFDRQAIPLEFLSAYLKLKQDEEMEESQPLLPFVQPPLQSASALTRITSGPPQTTRTTLSPDSFRHSKDEIHLTKALGVLKAFSFIAEDKCHGFDMHRLVQLVTRRWLIKQSKMNLFGKDALMAVKHAYDAWRDFGYEARGSAYLPHVYAVLECQGMKSRDENLARASLLCHTSHFLRDIKQWKKAKSFMVQARDLYRVELGEEHAIILAIDDYLAVVSQAQYLLAKIESLVFDLVEASKRKHGVEDINTVMSVSLLACMHLAQDRWQEAESLMEQTVQTAKSGRGREHPETLRAISLLGRIFHYGLRKETEKVGMQVATASMKVLEEENPLALDNMAELACMWKGHPDLIESLELLQGFFDFLEWA